MDVIQRLFQKLNSSAVLAEFIEDNFIVLYDCFNNINHSSLASYDESITQNLIEKFASVRQLDFSSSKKCDFVLLVLYTSIRLNDSFLFQKYYQLSVEKNIALPSVIKAAKHFMIGFSNLECGADIISKVINDLSVAEEEDNDIETEFFIVGNLLSVISDSFPFACDEVKSLQQLLKTQIEKALPHLSNNLLVSTLCSLEIEYGKSLQEGIKLEIDQYLNRVNAPLDFELSQYLIEKDTSYSEEILRISKPSFNQFRSIAVDHYSQLNNSNLYYQLQRGVAILKNTDELTAYMYSYGKMHDAKIRSCYEYINKDFFAEEVNVIDWGCGQGIGSVSLLDDLNKDSVSLNISKNILIEPSLVALKRASLHVSKYDVDYFTINKDFDSLSTKDFRLSCKRHFHIFSNILDVDKFSLSHLIDVFLQTFNGENFIVIASPNINATRINRLNLFINTIIENRQHQLIKNISQGANTWINGKNWTREIRILKVEI